MSLLENVCNKSGLPNNVCEGGPFLPSRVCYLVGGHSRLSWGGGLVFVDRESVVQGNALKLS